MAEKDSMSLCSHPWLFLTPRTEAQTEAAIQEGCRRPPSLLRKESHHPPFVRKLLHCWPSESQGKLPRDKRREVRIHLTSRVNSSRDLPHLSPGWPVPLLGTVTGPLPAPTFPLSLYLFIHASSPHICAGLRTSA